MTCKYAKDCGYLDCFSEKLWLMLYLYFLIITSLSKYSLNIVTPLYFQVLRPNEPMQKELASRSVYRGTVYIQECYYATDTVTLQRWVKFPKVRWAIVGRHDLLFVFLWTLCIHILWAGVILITSSRVVVFVVAILTTTTSLLFNVPSWQWRLIRKPLQTATAWVIRTMLT